MARLGDEARAAALIASDVPGRTVGVGRRLRGSLLGARQHVDGGGARGHARRQALDVALAASDRIEDALSAPGPVTNRVLAGVDLVQRFERHPLTSRDARMAAARSGGAGAGAATFG